MQLQTYLLPEVRNGAGGQGKEKIMVHLKVHKATDQNSKGRGGRGIGLPSQKLDPCWKKSFKNSPTDCKDRSLFQSQLGVCTRPWSTA
eukprot:1156319-Pelagomonas_calceolata.AAC.21